MSKIVEIQQRKDDGKSFILRNLSVMLHGCENTRDKIIKLIQPKQSRDREKIPSEHYSTLESLVFDQTRKMTDIFLQFSCTFETDSKKYLTVLTVACWLGERVSLLIQAFLELWVLLVAGLLLSLATNKTNNQKLLKVTK